MSNIEKGWIGSNNRASNEYIVGVQEFLEFAFSSRPAGDKILCPCRDCSNRYYHDRYTVRTHCIVVGFEKWYTNWTSHGEGYTNVHTSDTQINEDAHDNIRRMVQEGFGIPSTYDESHRIDDVVQSDETTLQFFRYNIPMTIQGSSSNADSSNNEGSTQNQISSSSSNRKQKGRGLAKKTPQWGKRQLVIDFDDSGNPCGGEYTKLATQLGYFVKDGTSFPLTTERWDQMDATVIDNIWNDIQSNTNAPVHARQFCIASMGDKWRDWKCRLKSKGYYKYKTDEERLEKCPVGVLENQWRSLVSMWGKEKIQEIAKTNKDNRSEQDCLPHTGKKPISVLKKERADQGLPVDRLNLFIASRKGATDETTLDMIKELQNESNELKETNHDTPEELEKLFVEHFGKDAHGRMRCSGRGITPSMVYGRKSGFSTTSTETVAAIRAEFEEKFELQKKETVARIQAERDACRVEMELQFQAFKQEMLSQFKSQL